jgi:NADH dehydrogenase [ubiquinone] 1 alpha subcomplex assembly factor 5
MTAQAQKPSSAIEVFDRNLLRRRRDRAAPKISQHDFLYAEVAGHLADRLSLIKREFPLVVSLGGAPGVSFGKRAGTTQVIRMDTSFPMKPAVVADEEFLPFRAGSIDAIVSNLNLHWVNDLPGALLQIRQALKPDGLLMAALLGNESLKELRQCLLEAELAVTGGASPRVSPFADAHDIGALMQRAGFALPVVDSDKITVQYSNPLKLMQDLRGMGASNATHNRLMKPTRRSVIMKAAQLYHEKFAGNDGYVPATFHVIYAIGWAPDASQPKPLQPGSAKNKLAEALKVVEVSAGEKAGLPSRSLPAT